MVGTDRVAVIVADGTGAFELGIAANLFGLDRSGEGLPAYRFEICSAAGEPVRSSSGFGIEATADLRPLRSADLVVVPPFGRPEDAVDANVVDALRAAHRRGALLFSICTGAFALAAAGLLDGSRATTHWQFADRLAADHPAVAVDGDALYVRDGRVLTSAGAAAGIDAGLSIVREWHGATVANAIARRLVVSAQRDGGQSQYVERPVAGPGADSMAGLTDWVLANIDRPLGVAELASRLHQSPRTFARRFLEATGTTPHRWLIDRRLDEAERLLESTTMPVERVASSVGFGSIDTLRHHLGRRRGTTPTAHRRRFGPAETS